MEAIFGLVFALGVMIFLFLALRKCVLWYFRIPERIEQNEQIIKLLRRVADKQ